MSKKLLLLLLFILPVYLSAQQVITGKVYDLENTTFPLQDVTVKNLNNNQSVKTRAAGQFSLPAKLGDLLVFSFTGYHMDTLFLIDLSPKTIYLPVNATELKEVLIQGEKINPWVLGPDPKEEDFRGEKRVGWGGKEKKVGGGGLKLNLG